MASYIPKHNALFIHAPRTGGTWVRRAMRQIGLEFHEVGMKHAHISSCQELFGLVRERNPFVFTFVRNPIQWYISHWSFRMSIISRGEFGWKPFDQEAIWHPTWAIDHDCASLIFQEFMEACLVKYPAYLTHLFHWYAKRPPLDEVNFIGRTENLEEDLIRALKEIGARFDPNNIRGIEGTNRSAPTYRAEAKYCRDLLYRVMDVERPAIERFGYSLDPNDYEDVLGGIGSP